MVRFSFLYILWYGYPFLIPSPFCFLCYRISAKAQAIIQEFDLQVTKPTTGTQGTSGNIIDVDALNRDQGVSPAKSVDAQQESLMMQTTSGAGRSLPSLVVFALAAVFFL